MDSHYALVNKLTAKRGKRDEVIKILLESGKSFTDNAACILYLVCEDATDPDNVWVVDVWTSKEAHTAALAQPELKPFIAQTIPLLEGMPEQVEVVPAGGKGL